MTRFSSYVELDDDIRPTHEVGAAPFRGRLGIAWSRLHRRIEIHPYLGAELYSLDVLPHEGTESLSELLAQNIEAVELSTFVMSAEERPTWSRAALLALETIEGGLDKSYAALAIRYVQHLRLETPRVYSAPGGGVVIEHRNKGNILTLIVEDGTALLLRTDENFVVRAQFVLKPTSVNELLGRYKEELRFLIAPPGG